MVEHARRHERLRETLAPGERIRLETGTLFLPRQARRGAAMPLLVHFHGAGWIAEIAAARRKMAAITVALGAGSAVYARPFEDRERFGRLLAEAQRSAAVRFRPIALSHWSAGYGAAREILKVPRYYNEVERLLAADSIHAGYAAAEPRPATPELVTADLEVFLRFAVDAAAGRKRMIVTHSEVYPGTYASTTETAEHLLRGAGLRRRAVLRWGPLGMQQISEARRGRLLVLGYAGNSAPDHLDHLHALPDFLRML
jgi:hypothetical protein